MLRQPSTSCGGNGGGGQGALLESNYLRGESNIQPHVKGGVAGMHFWEIVT